jgi:Ser/Thr protein kinase RdoA (MazF antagonist)
MTDGPLGAVIGAGKEAEIFEYGSAVSKLYRSNAPKRAAFREGAILALVESFGLPVPQVHSVRQIGRRWGVIMSRAEGPSFAEAMLANRSLLAAYLNEMARLHLGIHSHAAVQLPGAKARLATDIVKAEVLGTPQQDALLRRLADMPDGDRLCHGDFHPLNILGPLGRAIIVDWPNASRGVPAADVCRSYVLIRSVAPDIADAYVEAYAAVSNLDVQEVWAWLPLIAAARLAEGVPDEEEELLRMVSKAT